MTLYLEEDEDSHIVFMDILRWFTKISRLDINKDTNKGNKIGTSRDRRITWEGRFSLEWTHSLDVLGIRFNVKSLSETTDNNLHSNINDIKNII